MVITFCARLDNRDNGFLQIDNRVVENNYTDLSMEAYMVLTRCLANQSGWQIHWKYFEKKYHISSKKRRKAMNELVEKRHCIIQKIRNGSAWNYYYFFFELALFESETDDTLKNFSLPLQENPLKENPLKDFPAHINNIIYKINKNINKIKDKEKKE